MIIEKMWRDASCSYQHGFGVSEKKNKKQRRILWDVRYFIFASFYGTISHKS